jgi:signal peptidase I
MSSRPKAWLAALLTFFFPPIGFLYVGRWKWAMFSALAFMGLAGFLFEFVNMQSWVPTVVQLIFGGVLARIAYKQACRYEADRARPRYSRWYGLWSAALLFVFLVVGLRAFLFEPFRVPAGSMQPTLAVGAKFIAQKWGYGNYSTYGISLMRSSVSASVDRGDIFVFEFPPNRSLQYVKRIIGLPGDKIEYRNKRLSINGQELSQRPEKDYFDEFNVRYFSRFTEKLDNAEYAILLDKDRSATLPASQGFQNPENCIYSKEGVTCLVPQGHYFVLGDNRDNSLDSRFWGFVPKDHLIGKVVRVFP